MQKSSPARTTYTTLVRLIRSEIKRGMVLMNRAIEREKTVTYWRIGKHIAHYVLINKDRAHYGGNLFARLSRDLEVSQRLLYYSLEFYQKYAVLKSCEELSWSHFRILMRIRDEKQREKIEHDAIDKRLTCRQLQGLVNEIKQDEEFLIGGITVDAPHVEKVTLSVRRGRLYYYEIQEEDFYGGAIIDCGFNIMKTIPSGNNQRRYSKGQCINVAKIKDGFRLKACAWNKNLLYTFGAFVKDIIDGDTLWLDIDVGFGIWTRQKIRLRGIDTPELSSREGRRARDFVTSVLSKGMLVVVKTYSNDKYDRYLGDIFYLPQGTVSTIAEQGTFLNQKMLDLGLADIWRG